MFRERDAGSSDGEVRSGLPCGWGNSEGRSPYPKDPAAHFSIYNTKSRCYWYVYFLGGDHGSHAGIQRMKMKGPLLRAAKAWGKVFYFGTVYLQHFHLW